MCAMYYHLPTFPFMVVGGTLVSKHFQMSDGTPRGANASQLVCFTVPWWKGNSEPSLD